MWIVHSADMSTPVTSPVEPPPLPPMVPGSTLPQLELARILLIVQGALGTMASVETLIVMVATGAPLAFPLAASCGLTAATLVAAGRLSRNGRGTRRLVILLESMWLAGAAIDVGLSIALAHRGLELVPSLTRIVMPVGIIVLLTRPPVRAASRGAAR